MGHAFNQTIMDGLTRYYRMRGHNTAWIPGTDHEAFKQAEAEASDRFRGYMAIGGTRSIARSGTP